MGVARRRPTGTHRRVGRVHSPPQRGRAHRAGPGGCPRREARGRHLGWVAPRRRAARRSTVSDTSTESKAPHLLDRVVIRFAGDSGDGMQLAGDRFTTTSALLGNDLATFPDFPAEIRAPAGTLAGVSAFQVHISDHAISTPGDSPDVLVAMNPAALRANLGALPKGATIIANVDAFEERNLAKAGYETNPLADGSLSGYAVYEVPMTSITSE